VHTLHILVFQLLATGKYGINEINKKFKAKTQMLAAYKLKFNFKTDAGILNYLNDQIIEIKIR